MSDNKMPLDCKECSFYSSCMSAMHQEGCRIYPPKKKSESIIEKVFKIFKEK